MDDEQKNPPEIIEVRRSCLSKVCHMNSTINHTIRSDFSSLFIFQMNDSTSVLHKIANLYAEQLMSDICLVVGENRYPAHRVILCASSEVFQVMLMNPEWNECRESVIELKEEPCCVEVFPQFLRYLYVGQIRISLTAVMPMLALADKYNIKVSANHIEIGWFKIRH